MRQPGGRQYLSFLGVYCMHCFRTVLWEVAKRQNVLGGLYERNRLEPVAAAAHPTSSSCGIWIEQGGSIGNKITFEVEMAWL
mmetsp:Transcript_60274/g.82677  ORF Transcript_60274/g.82677 Transcript_60274/m.82677 type:complete len:82 (-) Transcript_60274:176-421(-)